MDPILIYRTIDIDSYICTLYIHMSTQIHIFIYIQTLYKP